MKNPKIDLHYPMVLIIWDDASGFRHGWMDKVDEPRPQLVMSVGFLIKDTPDYIIYASDTDTDGAHNGRTQIPRGMVKKIQILRHPTKKEQPLAEKQIQEPLRGKHLPE